MSCNFLPTANNYKALPHSAHSSHSADYLYAYAQIHIVTWGMCRFQTRQFETQDPPPLLSRSDHARKDSGKARRQRHARQLCA